MRSKYAWAFERLSKVERFLLVGICSAILVTVSIGVIARYAPTEIVGILTAPIEELSKILFVWLVFLGASAAYREGKHYKLSIVPGLLRGRARLVLLIVDSLVIAVFLLLGGMSAVVMLKADVGLLSVVMSWPVNLWTWAYLIGMSLMLIYTVHRVILYVKEFLR